VKEKTMNIEQRLNQMERQIKRQRMGLFVLAVALCGVVSMGSFTRSDMGFFDTVMAKNIWLQNDKGQTIVALGANDSGHGDVTTYDGKTGKALVSLSVDVGGSGMVTTYGPTGKELVDLAATTEGDGAIITYSPTGKKLVGLAVTTEGDGAIITYSPTGKNLVSLGVTENGGALYVHNRTGEAIVTLQADDYGNGEVGAWNRKGKGRVWDSQ
jgi:hypothetical protein